MQVSRVPSWTGHVGALGPSPTHDRPAPNVAPNTAPSTAPRQPDRVTLSAAALRLAGGSSPQADQGTPTNPPTPEQAALARQAAWNLFPPADQRTPESPTTPEEASIARRAAWHLFPPADLTTQANPRTPEQAAGTRLAKGQRPTGVVGPMAPLPLPSTPAPVPPPALGLSRTAPAHEPRPFWAVLQEDNQRTWPRRTDPTHVPALDERDPALYAHRNRWPVLPRVEVAGDPSPREGIHSRGRAGEASPSQPPAAAARAPRALRACGAGACPTRAIVPGVSPRYGLIDVVV